MFACVSACDVHTCLLLGSPQTQFTGLVFPGGRGWAVFVTIPGWLRCHRRFVGFLVTAGSQFPPGTKALRQEEEEEGLED